MDKSTLMVAFLTLTLGVVGTAMAKQDKGGGKASGASQTSEQGLLNQNTQRMPDATRGQERAQERRSEQATERLEMKEPQAQPQQGQKTQARDRQRIHQDRDVAGNPYGTEPKGKPKKSK